jgi:hypothetical protein
MRRQIVGGFLVAGAVVSALAIAIANPDMTDMRLWLEYWPGYLAILVAAFAGMWIWDR